jgi:acyl-[acyl-carrier-protein] desaturase
MPGTGIPDFPVHATAIANAGIYDFAIHHDQILVPVVLRHWRLESIEGLSPEAELARGKTVRYISRMARVSRRLAERREEMASVGQG